MAMAYPEHVFAGNVGQEDPNNRKLARLYPEGGYCWRPSDDTHDAYKPAVPALPVSRLKFE